MSIPDKLKSKLDAFENVCKSSDVTKCRQFLINNQKLLKKKLTGKLKNEFKIPINRLVDFGLLISIKHGSDKIIEHLLTFQQYEIDSGGVSDYNDKHWEGPEERLFEFALEKGTIDVVDSFIKYHPHLYSDRNPSLDYFIDAVCNNNNIDVLNLFLQYKAKLSNLSVEDIIKQTAMSIQHGHVYIGSAIASNNIKILEFLLSNGFKYYYEPEEYYYRESFKNVHPKFINLLLEYEVFNLTDALIPAIHDLENKDATVHGKNQKINCSRYRDTSDEEKIDFLLSNYVANYYEEYSTDKLGSILYKLFIESYDNISLHLMNDLTLICLLYYC